VENDEFDSSEIGSHRKRRCKTVLMPRDAHVRRGDVVSKARGAHRGDFRARPIVCYIGAFSTAASRAAF
jgi:hypothetical protein